MAVATAAGPAPAPTRRPALAGLPPQAAAPHRAAHSGRPLFPAEQPQPQQHNMASGSLRNGAREIDGSYIFMAGAGQGERGWGCRDGAADSGPPSALLPPAPPGRGGGGGGPLAPFPAFPTPQLRSLGPQLPAACQRQRRAPLPPPLVPSAGRCGAPHRRPPLPQPEALALPRRGPSPLTSHAGAKPSSEPRPPAPSRRRGPGAAPAAGGVAWREGAGEVGGRAPWSKAAVGDRCDLVFSTQRRRGGDGGRGAEPPAPCPGAGRSA